MESLFLPKQLEDINNRFLKFKETVNICHITDFFFLSKVLFDYKNQKWQAKVERKDDGNYKICIPCTFDFSLYKTVSENYFKHLKDVIMFALNFKHGESEERKLSIYISKKNLHIVSCSKNFNMTIKFFNGEPECDATHFTKEEILKLVC